MVAMDPVLYGKDQTENVVCVASKMSKIYVYTETADGVQLQVKSYTPWVLADANIDDQFDEMEGQNEFKWIRFFGSEKGQREFAREYRERVYKPRSLVDAYLLTSGTTYHKGMKRKDISVLSWDLETSGLKHDDRSKIYLIANTFRKGDLTERKLFDLSDYGSQKEMLEDWCAWVRKMNPSLFLGHNILTFDCPYLLYCASRCGAQIRIGRDGTEMQLANYESKYRVDGTRNIAYRQPSVFGREVLDTMFLMMSYDVGRKYQSYALKSLIKEAKLERPNRTMVNAAMIWQLWDRRHSDPAMWQAVREYAIFDGDDAISLWDLCGDSTFYPASQIPMTHERVSMSASGSQINAQLVRAYLADGHSIPKATEKRPFQGAISHGFPGIYRNCLSFDVNSLYPSILIQYSVFDKRKDPKGYVLHMVKEYRKQRLEYKRLASAGDPYYTALDSTAKRSLNSFYGFYGSKSSNFNSPVCAEFITKTGREILNRAVEWATGKSFEELLSLHDSKPA